MSHLPFCFSWVSFSALFFLSWLLCMPASLILSLFLFFLSPLSLGSLLWSQALVLGLCPDLTPSQSQGLWATPGCCLALGSQVVAGLGLVSFQLNLAAEPLLPLT